MSNSSKVWTGSSETVNSWIKEGVLLDRNGPSLLRIPSGSNGTGHSWGHCFVARHDLVEHVFSNSAHFHAGHYDRLMADLGSPLRLMPGHDHEKHGNRDAILDKAQKLFKPKIDGDPVPPDEWLRHTAAKHSHAVLEVLAASPDSAEKFNLVWDYGRIVPYLVFTEFMGVILPVRTDLGAKAWNFIRNVIQPHPPARMEGVQGEIWTLVFWSQMFFMHLFANFENKPLRRRLAQYGLGRLNTYVRFWEQHPSAIDPDGFFAAILTANRGAPPCEKLSREHICAIFLEFLGTAYLLPSDAFCNLIEALFDREFGTSSDIDFNRFVSQIRNAQHASDWSTCFEELLRLVPLTSRIDRVAKKHLSDDAMIDEVPIRENDRVTLLIEQAARDPRAFGRPDWPSKGANEANKQASDGSEIYNPSDTRKYLEFRPSAAPRRCFGRLWALTLLREMTLALDDKYVVRPVDENNSKLKRVLGEIPDHMMVKFT